VLCERISIERQLVELKAVQHSDAGVYECCAMNYLDMDCTNFTLIINNGI